MRSRNVFWGICFLFIVLACAAQVVQVFRNRYDQGDVHAPYSTYRTDPMGTSALYAALGAMPGITVSRNIEEIAALEGGAGRCILFAGATEGPDAVDVADALDNFVADGGSIVITFNMRQSYEEEGKEAPEDEAEVEEETEEDAPFTEDAIEEDERKWAKRPTEEVAKKKEEIEEKYRDVLARMGMVDLEDRWGFKLRERRMPRPGGGERAVLRVTKVAEDGGAATLPAAVSWYSPGYFDGLEESWKAIYARDDSPVLIERKYPGGGSIVLASDPYFLSNEALRTERETALLTWLLTRQPEVIFDETHLGTVEPSFIMGLILRYRLHGVLAVFALLAALYIWKNASSLTPRIEAAEADAPLRTQLGKDASAAMVHLLRRTVPADKLLGVCFAEWRHTAPKDPGTTRSANEMARLLQQETGGNAEAVRMRYRELCEILARRHTG